MTQCFLLSFKQVGDKICKTKFTVLLCTTLEHNILLQKEQIVTHFAACKRK